MGRPKINLTEEQINYLKQLALESNGNYSVDILRSFTAKFDCFKLGKSTLKRRFLEIWTEINSNIHDISSYFLI